MGSTVFVSVIFFQDPAKSKQINYQIFIAFFPLLVQKSSVAEPLGATLVWLEPAPHTENLTTKNQPLHLNRHFFLKFII